MLGGASPLGAADSGLQPWSGPTPSSFTLPDSVGTERALEAERGSVVLVHFFATWCEPCREELPALNRLTERANGAVRVIAISVAEVDPRVRRFLETMPVKFPVLLDRDRSIAKAWNVSTLPTTVVLDSQLRAKLVVETDFAWDGIDLAKLPGMVAGASDGKTSPRLTTAKPDHGGG